MTIKYSKKQIEEIEELWAFHANGRSALLNTQDFATLMAWQDEGIGIVKIKQAIERYFAARKKKGKTGADRQALRLEYVAKEFKQIDRLNAGSYLADDGSASLNPALSTLPPVAARRQPSAIEKASIGRIKNALQLLDNAQQGLARALNAQDIDRCIQLEQAAIKNILGLSKEVFDEETKKRIRSEAEHDVANAGVKIGDAIFRETLGNCMRAIIVDEFRAIADS